MSYASTAHGCWLRHRYEVIDKIVMPSAWEQMTAHHDLKVESLNMRANLYHKDVVVTLRCRDCASERVDRR